MSSLQSRCTALEECYEFTLTYAAQGHGAVAGVDAQLRHHLGRAAEAIHGLEDAAAGFTDFASVLAPPARGTLAAIRLLLAQPAISSQMMDSFNASLHLRTLLADLFLLSEVLQP